MTGIGRRWPWRGSRFDRPALGARGLGCDSRPSRAGQSGCARGHTAIAVLRTLGLDRCRATVDLLRRARDLITRSSWAFGDRWQKETSGADRDEDRRRHESSPSGSAISGAVLPRPPTATRRHVCGCSTTAVRQSPLPPPSPRAQAAGPGERSHPGCRPRVRSPPRSSCNAEASAARGSSRQPLPASSSASPSSGTMASAEPAGVQEQLASGVCRCCRVDLFDGETRARGDRFPGIEGCSVRTVDGDSKPVIRRRLALRTSITDAQGLAGPGMMKRAIRLGCGGRRPGERLGGR